MSEINENVVTDVAETTVDQSEDTYIPLDEKEYEELENYHSGLWFAGGVLTAVAGAALYKKAIKPGVVKAKNAISNAWTKHKEKKAEKQKAKEEAKQADQKSKGE